MMVLWEGKRMTVGEIAKRLLLQTNTVTPLLKRIESMGLITKTQGTEDHRREFIELTAKGKKMEDTASCIPQTQVERILCNGGSDELIPGLNIRLDSLITVLQAITEGVESAD